MYEKKLTFLGGKNNVDLDKVLNYEGDKQDDGVDNADFSPAVKKKVLIACLFSLVVGNMMMLNVAAFLPTYISETDWVIAEDGYEISTQDISLILSVFSVAQIMFAPFNALIKNKVGTKNAILLGFLVATVTTYGLGAIARVKDPRTFKYIAVALRFFQG
jgi:MFS family permease